jgi:hypothetical protein
MNVTVLLAKMSVYAATSRYAGYEFPEGAPPGAFW